MRIVAGKWRGRRLLAPRGLDTRPTSDRVREAVFASLESLHSDSLVGGAILDAFAGTGALALEALSRGARSAVAVESQRRAFAALTGNIAGLGADGCQAVFGDVLSLAHNARLPGGPFSLLLLDPPYRIERAQVRGLLEHLAATGMLRHECVAVFEHAVGAPAEWPEGFVPESDRKYGDTEVSVAVFARGG